MVDARGEHWIYQVSFDGGTEWSHWVHRREFDQLLKERAGLSSTAVARKCSDARKKYKKKARRGMN